MSEILFEITKDKLETGLRGVPVGYCTTSFVDPQKGLFYVDRPISTVSSWKPIEAMYLIYHGKEGTKEEVATFYGKLQERAVCPPAVIQAITSLPKEGHPMKLFSAALLILGMFVKTGDYREDALQLIGKCPHLIACVINHHAGFGMTPAPCPELGYIESFASMLQVPHADLSQLTAALNLFHILHLDHGGGNLSAFVGKATASGLADLYESMTAAMCALAGPRHGKANQDSLEFIQGALKELGDKADEATVEAWMRGKLSRHELIFGFGHAVLRVEDPRATTQYAYVNRHYPHHPLVKMANLLRKVGPKILGENPKISDPHPNVDAISGTLLTVSGFPYPEYYTILFGFARILGISTQIIYERYQAREGKGTPIIRPKYFFKSRS
ncbi:MAG: putative type 1 citrate synthase [Chlamydiota bacterium]|jgi:citrate synthase